MVSCPASLDELAYNHHWSGGHPISLKDLKDYGLDEEVGDIIEYIPHIIDMWRQVLKDMENIEQERDYNDRKQ
ncbi:MAG: hypothetical protein CMF74_12605 [Maricaulis sp.]|nr:hypothetical protein [Maricaulis sp.]